MKSKEIVLPKKTVYMIGIGLVILAAVLLGWKSLTSGSSQTDSVAGANLVAGSPEKFAFLSGQGEQRSVGST